MANKPVWIVCSNKEWLDKIIENLAGGSNCPPPLEDQLCPKDKDGNNIPCEDCWRQYVDCEAISDE